MENSELRDRLLAESGRLSWPELAPHFARGVVVSVSAPLDLVEVAAALAEDDTSRAQAWLESGEVSRASDEDARRWAAAGTEFSAVVVAPWVLVKEV